MIDEGHSIADAHAPYDAVAKLVDIGAPHHVAAAAVSIRAAIVAAAVVRPAADHRAGRKTADKARAESAAAMAMPMLRSPPCLRRSMP